MLKKSDSIEQYLNSVLVNRNILKIIELNVNEIIINTQDSVREFNCYAVTRVSVYVCASYREVALLHTKILVDFHIFLIKLNLS